MSAPLSIHRVLVRHSDEVAPVTRTDAEDRELEMSEYVVLLMGDADRWWVGMTEDERREGYAAHGRFSAELERRGHRVTGGAELHPSSQARTIAPETATVTEGPWAESTEQVGGFYVVESDDLDDLMECCTILAATGDAVEVRRTVTEQERPS
jgi:hypothetical protein